jgi:hypothetical protein
MVSDTLTAKCEKDEIREPPAQSQKPAIDGGPARQPHNTLSIAPLIHPKSSTTIINTIKTSMSHLPKYKDLPPVKGMPHGCAWGIWDKPGEPKDQLGSLNLLTPEVVKEAILEVKTGERCALKLIP